MGGQHHPQQRLAGASILHMVLLQGIGRSFVLCLNHEGPNCTTIDMTGEALRVIAALEHDQPLALWQFAQACSRLEEQSRAWRSTRSTPTASIVHEATPSTDLMTSDPHLFPSRRTFPNNSRRRFKRSATSMEAGCHGSEERMRWRFFTVTRRIPCMCRGMIRLAGSLFVGRIRGAGLVTRPRAFRGTAASWTARRGGGRFAFWLWQLKPGVAGAIAALSRGARHLCIDVEIVDPSAWFGKLRTDCPTESSVECLMTRLGHIVVRLGPSATTLLHGADNAGERELVRGFLRGLR